VSEQARDQLEAERDFLFTSLDDLELEHESGGIDDESYEALRDDYTARAAATIRALRDGGERREGSTSGTPVKRRAAIVAVVLVFAVGAGVALAGALGVRLPGQTSSGNAQSDTQDVVDAVGRRIESLQKQVNAAPDDYDLRLDLADAYARNNDLRTAIEQWDAAAIIDPNRPEAHAQIGRALYLVSEQVPDANARAQVVANARVALDQATTVDPEYADAYFFRGVLLSAIGELARGQADLQTYLLKAPDGMWSESAHAALADVTEELEKASTTVPSSP
jgi:cytochrome c-type biogenesis protein CcmH/NrfG